MEMTDADIAAFQKTWKAEFKEEITSDRARAELSRLLDFYVELIKSQPSEGQPSRLEKATLP